MANFITGIDTTPPDKKPSHQEIFFPNLPPTVTRVADSKLKILITVQKGKVIIARQAIRHSHGEKGSLAKQ
jgi:hypothetical protein